jgi:hypothetical protein
MKTSEEIQEALDTLLRITMTHGLPDRAHMHQRIGAAVALGWVLKMTDPHKRFEDQLLNLRAVMAAFEASKELAK